ncbi:MAG: site-specific integrase, partial [Thermomicrobiales bacterium]
MWDAVALDDGVILVRRSATRDQEGNEVVGDSTKTGKARSIVLTTEAAAALRRWRVVQVTRRVAHKTWSDLDIVFDRGDGQMLSNATLQLIHDRTVAEAGVSDIRLHDIRHTYATLAFAAGEHPKIVSEIMGHASVAFTLDRYTHMSAELQQRAAASISRRLFAPDEPVSDDAQTRHS